MAEMQTAVSAALLSELEDQVERLLAAQSTARANPSSRASVAVRAEKIIPILESVLLHGMNRDASAASVHSTSITSAVCTAEVQPAAEDAKHGPGLAVIVDRIGGNPAVACAQMVRFLKRATSSRRACARAWLRWCVAEGVLREQIGAVRGMNAPDVIVPGGVGGGGAGSPPAPLVQRRMYTPHCALGQTRMREAVFNLLSLIDGVGGVDGLESDVEGLGAEPDVKPEDVLPGGGPAAEGPPVRSPLATMLETAATAVYNRVWRGSVDDDDHGASAGAGEDDPAKDGNAGDGDDAPPTPATLSDVPGNPFASGGENGGEDDVPGNPFASDDVDPTAATGVEKEGDGAGDGLGDSAEDSTGATNNGKEAGAGDVSPIQPESAASADAADAAASADTSPAAAAAPGSPDMDGNPFFTENVSSSSNSGKPVDDSNSVRHVEPTAAEVTSTNENPSTDKDETEKGVDFAAAAEQVASDDETTDKPRDALASSPGAPRDVEKADEVADNGSSSPIIDENASPGSVSIQDEPESKPPTNGDGVQNAISAKDADVPTPSPPTTSTPSTTPGPENKAQDHQPIRSDLAPQLRTAMAMFLAATGRHPLTQVDGDTLLIDPVTQRPLTHPPHTLDDRGWTPLHHAASRGDLGAVRALLAADAPLIAATGWRTGHDSSDGVLRDAKDDGTEILTAAFPAADGGCDSETPLETREEEEEQEQGEDPLAGATPLHIACAARAPAVAACLLLAGCSRRDVTRGGRTPLHVAAASGCDGCVGLLLGGDAAAPNRGPASVDVDSVDDKGNTPLHLAVLAGEPLVVEALLDAGASMLAKNNDGETPRRLALLAEDGAITEPQLGSSGSSGRRHLARVPRAIHVLLDQDDPSIDHSSPHGEILDPAADDRQRSLSLRGVSPDLATDITDTNVNNNSSNNNNNNSSSKDTVDRLGDDGRIDDSFAGGDDPHGRDRNNRHRNRTLTRTASSFDSDTEEENWIVAEMERLAARLAEIRGARRGVVYAGDDLQWDVESDAHWIDGTNGSQASSSRRGSMLQPGADFGGQYHNHSSTTPRGGRSRAGSAVVYGMPPATAANGSGAGGVAELETPPLTVLEDGAIVVSSARGADLLHEIRREIDTLREADGGSSASGLTTPRDSADMVAGFQGYRSIAATEPLPFQFARPPAVSDGAIRSALATELGLEAGGGDHPDGGGNGHGEHLGNENNNDGGDNDDDGNDGGGPSMLHLTWNAPSSRHHASTEARARGVSDPSALATTTSRPPLQPGSPAEFVPPRMQLLFHVPRPVASMSEALESQGHRCSGCGVRIVKGLLHKPRYCNYTGRYYCHGCHKKNTYVSPARILWSWDARPYAMSEKAIAFLTSVRDMPCFDIMAINPKLVSIAPALAAAQGVRARLRLTAAFVNSCPRSDALLAMFGDRTYLLEADSVYSLRDLVNIEGGRVERFMATMFANLVKHITKYCMTCKGRATICEYCSDARQLLFPFDVEHAVQCQRCGTLYHRLCFHPENCPKCDRLRRRKEVQRQQREKQLLQQQRAGGGKRDKDANQ